MTAAEPTASHGHAAAEGAAISCAEIESVVASACRAPSIHNTQPWQWTFHDEVLDVRADRGRQLSVADRDGHSLLVSCGAAAQLTELALSAHGWAATPALLPNQADPDLLVRLHPVRCPDATDEAAGRLAAALKRRSERRPFGPEAVSAEIVERLRLAAAAPGLYVHFAVKADESLDLAVAISEADRWQRHDSGYAAEMAAWVRSNDGSPDGVPYSAIPQVLAGQPRHTDIPLRDFEAGVPGGQLLTPIVDERPLIGVIFTDVDSERERLRAGQAMMRLMVQAELDGIASCPLSQSVDLLAFRSRLRMLMSWTGHPQMMLRLGQKPDATPAPLTARRPVSDVLIVS